MKRLFNVLVFFLTTQCIAASFTDPKTGLTFEVPAGFIYSEEESGIDEENGKWWYLFSDSNQGTITIDIEEHDYLKSHYEHFYQRLTGDENEIEGVVYEGMEFKNIECNGIEITKCRLRVLGVSDQLFEPVVLWDYLFVKDHFGFSISLIKNDDGIISNERSEIMMLNLLDSIDFIWR